MLPRLGPSLSSLALVGLALLGCGGAGHPPAAGTTGSVSKPGAASAPTPQPDAAPTSPAGAAPARQPAPAPGATSTYRAQNQTWGRLRAFTIPPVARRPPFRLVHLSCFVDQTVLRPRYTCRGGAAARAGSLDASQAELLRWMRTSLGLTDGKVPAGLARKVTQWLNDGTPLVTDPGVVIALTDVAINEYDEARTFGCEHAKGHPCDPVTRRTGRKVKQREVTGPGYFYQGKSLALHLALENLLAMVDGAVIYQPVEYALLVGDGAPPPQDDLLRRAMDLSFARAALLELATSTSTDPVVRQILAYDRAVVAARLGDHDATVAAVAALEAELAPGVTPTLEPMVTVALPFLRRIVSGELVFTPPAGLDAFLSSGW